MGLQNERGMCVPMPLNDGRLSMTIERRSHPRTSLRVPIFLLPPDCTVPLRTETENVGIDGFFCYTEHLFSPGDCVKFLLFLPSAAATESQSSIGVCVHGEAEIIRVTVGPTNAGYGVGYRFNTYRVRSESDAVATEEAVTRVLKLDW
jgi:hypothetical protein